MSEPVIDEAVIQIHLRRVDPPNPDGGASPDTASTFNTPNPASAELLEQLCVEFGFDPEMSTIQMVSVSDRESEGGSISLADLKRMTHPEDEPVQELSQPEVQDEEQAETPGVLDPPETETEEPPVTDPGFGGDPESVDQSGFPQSD